VHYRLTITDDFTRWRWPKLITNKREETILEAFKEYKAMREAQHPVYRLVTTRELSSLGSRLQPGARSMALKHNTQCVPH
jgi:hypothetical protein